MNDDNVEILKEEFDAAVTEFDDLTEVVRDKELLDSKEVAAIINAANTAIEKAQRIIYGE